LVQNTPDSRSVSDPLSQIARRDPSGPIRFAELEEEDFTSIIEYARPYGGARRDGYHIQLARQWWVNLLFYLGIQNFDIPDVLQDIDPGVLMATDTAAYTANHIMRMVLGNVARLTQARVDWSVVPNTPDEVDQEGARVAQAMLDYLNVELDLEAKRLELALWLDITGTAFVYSNWDSTKGDIRKHFYDPMTGSPADLRQMHPDQAALMQKWKLYTEESEGDHDCEVLSSFDVWMPTRYRELKKMPWVLIRRTMSPEEVWNRWPDKAGELSSIDSKTERLDQYRNRLATLARRPGLGLANAVDDDGAVDIDEFWMPPSKRCPTGLYIAANRRLLLETSEHPFAKAGLDIRFPIVDFHNIKVPGRFHSMSTVEHLIGPQQEYNKARQQVIDHRDILSVAQWIAPVGALAKGRVRNENGDVIEYNRNIGKPELVAPPPLGDAQIISGQQAQSDMQMISSFSDASLGNMPQGARSGNAVAMLQERDQLGITPTVKGVENAFARLGSHLLKLEWKFRKWPRAVQIYGESRQSDIRFFKGGDINGNTRVFVKPGSLTPKSRAQTMELLSQMLQLQVLNPMDPRQQRLVLEALDVGGSEKLFLAMDGQARRARIENNMFAKPAPDQPLPDVMQWDDHQVHIEKHQEFIVTDQFELLDPFLKQLFLAHMQKHVNAVAEMMMAQQAMAQAAGGPGPGGGSPDAKPLGKPSPPRQNDKQPAAAGTDAA